MSTFVKRHPLATFLVVSIGVTWAVQFTLLASGRDLTPGLLIELAVLLGMATAITGVTDGRAGVRRLYSGLIRWRIGIGHWLGLLLAMPALTILVGAATGTLRQPTGGWGLEALAYAFGTLVFGLLLANAWEETAWAGFVQTRLQERHGLVGGSLLTAVPYFLIHIPLAVSAAGWPVTDFSATALNLTLLAAAAPFFRYLAGVLLVNTGGSVLAVGLLHASFNASGALSVVDGWQYLPAMLAIALLVAAHRAWRGSAGRAAVGRRERQGSLSGSPAPR
jgi:membrane protease YdiL (CAAX protease family)